jgi:hypothetical protein
VPRYLPKWKHLKNLLSQSSTAADDEKNPSPRPEDQGEGKTENRSMCLNDPVLLLAWKRIIVTFALFTPVARPAEKGSMMLNARSFRLIPDMFNFCVHFRSGFCCTPVSQTV